MKATQTGEKLASQSAYIHVKELLQSPGSLKKVFAAIMIKFKMFQTTLQ